MVDARAEWLRPATLDPLLLKVEEAARLVGIGRSQMYKLLADGTVPSVAIGRSRRVPLESLRQWVDRQIASDADAA